MTQPENTRPGSPSGEPGQSGGRYRFQDGRSLDPDAGVHPEMLGDASSPVAGGIPSSPQELMALQQAIDLIEALDTTAAEDQQIALAIVRHLEAFHDEIVKELQDDDDASHSQIVRWAVDADRLFRARMLLESVDLE